MKFDPSLRRELGWRAVKGPQVTNKSGFRATGHRVLLQSEAVEITSPGGIVLTKKIIDQDKAALMTAVVVEIGYDAWADKSTDYCQVGDTVLIGQYSGKFETSKLDGKEYRFVNDLDIISPIFSGE